jgi:hypothetical protein
MPFIAVDLDALDELDDAALLACISPGDMVRGTLRVWRHCFRNKTAHITLDRLASFFPGDIGKVAIALVTCEFLDRPTTRPDYHVRGAEKRLGIRDAQSEAGKKSIQNLKQFRKNSPALPGGVAGDEPDGEPEPTSGSTPALTPNTQHPTPKQKEKNIVEISKNEVSTSEKAKAVFDYWKLAFGKTNGAKFDSDRKTKVEARLNEGRTVEDIKQAIDGCLLSPWHRGENPDGKIYDDLELICRDAKHLEGFMATAQAPPKPKIQDVTRGRIEASQIDWNSQEAGIKEGFG